MDKGILFDMDGLLVDSEPLLCKAVIESLKKQSIYLKEEEFYSHWTRKGKNIVDFIKERKANADITKYRKDKNDIYFGLIEKSLRQIPGAKDKVIEFSKIYKLALVSSSNKEMISSIIKLIGLQSYFAVIVASDHVKRHKPAPVSFLLAAELLKINPENCVVIEDAEKGIIAAKNAGMKVIAIPNKHTKDNDFSKADYVLDSITNLNPKLIDLLLQ